MTHIRYVCMPGQSYTGSTLLAFLLNAHPDAVSVGAASGLIASVDPTTYECSCGARLADCAFYRELARVLNGRGFPFDPVRKPWPTAYQVSRRRWANVVASRSLRNSMLNDVRDMVVRRVPSVSARLAAITSFNVAFARAACEIAGVSTFVDSSRDPLRPRYLVDAPGIDVKVVHLVRDARGNVASIMRHVPGLPVTEAARRWYRANAEARRVIRALPAGSSLTVHYEDLCADAQDTIDMISDHVGIPRAPVPEDFRVIEHHILGNEMRLGGSGRVRVDERWREVLSAADLDTVAARCGKLNRELGYRWP